MNVTLNTQHPWDGDRATSAGDTRAGASLVGLWSPSRGLISVFISRSEVSPLLWLPALAVWALCSSGSQHLDPFRASSL